MGISDEGTSAVDQFGDQLADREGEAGTESGGEGGPPPVAETGAAREEEDDEQGRGEESSETST